MAPPSITAGASRWCRATSNARRALSPDGVLELRIGAHSHGQGMETTMAQVANTVLGVDPENVRLVHGDTATTPYSTGTWGFAQHGDVGRRGGGGLRGDRQPGQSDRGEAS